MFVVTGSEAVPLVEIVSNNVSGTGGPTQYGPLVWPGGQVGEPDDGVGSSAALGTGGLGAANAS